MAEHQNTVESTPEASVPGSTQGREPKPEHTISGPDGVTLTPDSQAARQHLQSRTVESPAGSGPAPRRGTDPAEDSDDGDDGDDADDVDE